jgi:tRNA dimethylallyltransferase
MRVSIGATGDSWQKKVVEPCVDVVKRFLSDDSTVLPNTSASDGVVGSVRAPSTSRELWMQYVCEVTLVFRELYYMHRR